MSEENETFTVKLRGVPMQISRSQIQADTPGGNFFAASLLGDFAEASERTLSLDRHPAIFKLILDHLSGYRIFPLDKIILKSFYGDGMSVERALRYIQDDAEYYGFSRLHALASDEIERMENQEESHQDEIISLKRYKMELEKMRLQLDIDLANKKAIDDLHEERLKILKIHIDIAARKLEAAAIVAAPRQVGSAGYGRDELQQLSRLTQRLRIFGGNDIMYPLPGEDDWIYNEERAEAPQMHYDIPELPPRRGSCHATPEEAGNGSNTDAMI